MKTLMVSLVLLVSCSSHHHQENKSSVSTHSAQAEIAGKVKGKVTFTPSIKGAVMRVKVSGLKPDSAHGFHIHEFGLCDQPDYKSAGGHFNPSNHAHGGPSQTAKHLGDLGNLTANSAGVAEKELVLNDLKDVHLINNKSVIIHEGADDFSSQPSGNSGSRIGCGIITIN